PPVHLEGLRLGARVAAGPGPDPDGRLRPPLQRERQPAPPGVLLQGALRGRGARLLPPERGAAGVRRRPPEGAGRSASLGIFARSAAYHGLWRWTLSAAIICPLDPSGELHDRSRPAVHFRLPRRRPRPRPL